MVTDHQAILYLYLNYKSNLDKDNLFKPRKVNLPVSDKIIDQELDLNFNSEK
mgnify:CR=1 FL=1